LQVAPSGVWEKGCVVCVWEKIWDDENLK
jgi:hypothetical protein